jgi:hypothetical protein
MRRSKAEVVLLIALVASAAALAQGERAACKRSSNPEMLPRSRGATALLAADRRDAIAGSAQSILCTTPKCRRTVSSANGNYVLSLSDMGALSLAAKSAPGKPLWSVGPFFDASGPYQLSLRPSGSLILLAGGAGQAVWTSGSACQGKGPYGVQVRGLRGLMRRLCMHRLRGAAGPGSRQAPLAWRGRRLTAASTD